MTQAQILAKWLELAQEAKRLIQSRDLASFGIVDELATQIMLAKIMGLPSDDAESRPTIGEANAIISEYVGAVSYRWSADRPTETQQARHAAAARALDEFLTTVCASTPREASSHG